MIVEEKDIKNLAELPKMKSLVAYLKEEKERHRNDEMTAKGKVTEIEELLRRVTNSCHICGQYIYPSFSDKPVDRIGEHIEDKHTLEEVNSKVLEETHTTS